MDHDNRIEVDGVWEPLVRCRLLARDFKGKDKGMNDLFAETPPLEAKKIILSRVVTQKIGGRWRSIMFIDAKKAHLRLVYVEDVYIELPEECGEDSGMCGKRKH